MSAVRTPPRPPFEGKRGRCAMCGKEPPGRRRSWCSDECVRVWWLATSPAVALAELEALHGSVCWECGRSVDYLEVEHRRPLWSLTAEERRELRWWLPFNLQLLCAPCHKAKSRHEAVERAALRRLGVLGTIEPSSPNRATAPELELWPS